MDTNARGFPYKTSFSCWVTAGFFATPFHLRLSVFIRGSNCFHSKLGQTGNQRKFLSIKAKDRLGRALKNVLTEKMGHFWGLMAEKRGGRRFKTPFFFVFFRVLGICSPGRR
jgi:hypothetical protein